MLIDLLDDVTREKTLDVSPTEEDTTSATTTRGFLSLCGNFWYFIKEGSGMVAEPWTAMGVTMVLTKFCVSLLNTTPPKM